MTEHFCSTCCFVPCWAHTFEHCVTTVSGACCIIVIGHTNVSRTLGPRSTRAEKTFIAIVIRPHSCITLAVLPRITQLTGSLRGLVSDIVVSSWSAWILGGKFRAIRTKMSIRTGRWGDCGPIAVFTWRQRYITCC